MKGIIHDLNHDLTFSAHTINCVWHSIRSMFRVLGIYNFELLIKRPICIMSSFDYDWQIIEGHGLWQHFCLSHTFSFKTLMISPLVIFHQVNIFWYKLFTKKTILYWLRKLHWDVSSVFFPLFFSIQLHFNLKSDWKWMSLYKWPCYDHFWPFFRHLYVHLSQN